MWSSRYSSDADVAITSSAPHVAATFVCGATWRQVAEAASQMLSILSLCFVQTLPSLIKLTSFWLFCGIFRKDKAFYPLCANSNESRANRPIFITLRCILMRCLCNGRPRSSLFRAVPELMFLLA